VWGAQFWHYVKGIGKRRLTFHHGTAGMVRGAASAGECGQQQWHTAIFDLRRYEQLQPQ
jgi:hypothetical protein